MPKILILSMSHVIALILGFAAGIYALPLLIAPEAPTQETIALVAAQAEFTGEFKDDLTGSDRLHWGEGKVLVGKHNIALEGRIAPGPDYKLYLSPEFVQTEVDFLRLKPQMVLVGDVKTFENFVVPVPDSVNPRSYKAVIIWCETFGQFITAAQYR